VFGFRVTCAIRQRFLHDSVNAGTLRIAQIIQRTIDPHGSRHACMPRELATLPLKSRFDTDIVKHRWTQTHREIANCSHSVGIQAFYFFHAVAERLDISAAQSLQMSEFHAEGRHHLSDFIMQFARQRTSL
jgi:hypothetical protein